MYKATSLRDAYHKLKKSNNDYLLAFGQNSYFMFILGDAKAIVKALPDVEQYNEVDYTAVRIHATQFFEFSARLKAIGLKVAIVSRSVNGNKVSYRINGWSDK